MGSFLFFKQMTTKNAPFCHFLERGKTKNKRLWELWAEGALFSEMTPEHYTVTRVRPVL